MADRNVDDTKAASTLEIIVNGQKVAAYNMEGLSPEKADRMTNQVKHYADQILPSRVQE